MKLKTSPEIFQNEIVPPATRLAGYSAIIHSLDIKAPLRSLTSISDKHIADSSVHKGQWKIYDKRYWPGDHIIDHLEFALKHECLDLLVLKKALIKLSPGIIENLVRKKPTGTFARRIWFFYEFLTDRKLQLPDIKKEKRLKALELLDPNKYYTSPGEISHRHGIRDNLLGNSRFCPIIQKTEVLESLISKNFSQMALTISGRVSSHIISRAASFLLLADSQASFEIEGERPPRNRIERWGKALLESGKNEISVSEITRLHGILIEDSRFIKIGIRKEGVFLGERDHDGYPLPEFIGTRVEDLNDLIGGLLISNSKMSDAGLDPVLQATIIAFAFVYIHPLDDGNGRLHRYLLHHILSKRGFTPKGIVFPLSSVLLERIEKYRETLQAHSKPLMPYIQWQTDKKRNVKVTNDTSDLYRYADYTAAAELIYGCVQRTIEHSWPREIDYLQRHDLALREIMNEVELPDSLAQMLIVFVRQNKGVLAKRKRQKEFEALTDIEVARLQEIINEVFAGFES